MVEEGEGYVDEGRYVKDGDHGRFYDWRNWEARWRRGTKFTLHCE